jgi:2,3-dihydroxybenzoate-AMP ligase
MKNHGIAAFKIPERLEIIDNLPLVGGIKVDKKQLRKDIEAKLGRSSISLK